jgi:mono/diheme cytochrome c family protein
MPLREQLRVRMPTFHWDDGEAAAVADYFANRSLRDWPARYARKLALALGKTSEDLAVDMQETGFSGVSGTQLRAIMNGKQAETQALFPKLLDYGVAKDFGIAGPVDPAYESVSQRQPSHLDARLAEEPELFDKVHDLVVRGPNCVQCHFLKGRPPTAEGPVAWAPDLDLTRERLRPDWLREWLVDPSKIYPGTAMPANFPLDQRVWQDLYPRSSREQIEAVLTWLFNLDRAQPQN